MKNLWAAVGMAAVVLAWCPDAWTQERSGAVGVGSAAFPNFINVGNTNYLYISGSISNYANGNYVYLTSTPIVTYSNGNATAGSYSLLFHHDDVAADGFTFTVSNSVAGEQIGIADATLPGTQWYTAHSGAGQDTATAVFGNTNTVSIPAFSGVSTSTNLNIWVDATNGNDLAFVRGNPAWPTRTIAKAISVTTNPTIYVAAGVYMETVPLGLTNSARLIGSGKQLTIISNQLIMIGTNPVVKDLTCMAITIGSGNGITTNWYLDNVESIGLQDGIFFQPGWRNGKARNCIFSSPWDCVADYGGVTPSNRVAIFENCHLINDTNSIVGGINGPEALVPGGGHLKFYGGTMRQNYVTGGIIAPTISGQTGQQYGTNGSVECFGVQFIYPTNSMFMISNGLGANIKLHGCWPMTNGTWGMPPTTIYDPSNKVSFVIP